MKFRRLALTIEAEQWFANKKVDGVYTTFEDSPISMVPDEKGMYTQVGFIDTLEGVMVVNPGDWIITGVEGEKYACNDRIFKKIYYACYE